MNTLMISTVSPSSSNASDWTVILGRLKQSGSNPNEVSVSVKNISLSSGSENNVAVLQLSRKPTLSDYIQPICVDRGDNSFTVNTQSWASGWGSGGGAEQTLQQFNTTIQDCGNKSSSTSSICTEVMPLEQTHKGGPLMCKFGQSWVQAAVLSLGSNLTKVTRASTAVQAFTKTSNFSQFLQSVVGSFPPKANTTSPAATTASSSALQCGVATLNTRILGGQGATPGFWPWQVSIHRNGSHFCGGSLINSDWVLTSGTCVNSFSPTSSRWTVLLGRQTQDSNNPNEVSRSVLKVFKHSSFNSSTFDNDIGLLQLNSSVTFTQYISPVCLAAGGSTVFNSTSAWLTGWGINSTKAPPNTLQEVEVPVIGNRKCNCLYGVGMIRDNMMCAGGIGGKGLCDGDFGSPLVIKQNGRWIQAGIGSFNKGCGLENYPDVYTRVSQYQTWITETIFTNMPGLLLFKSNGTDGDLSESCDGLPAVTTPAPTTTTTSAPCKIVSVVCGNAKLNTITGGGNSLASAGVWPWMASLQRNGTHVCGGTLVAEQFVLSSADCFSSSSNASDWTVILGRLKQGGSNANEVSVSVKNISLSSGSENNVAVLQLSRKPTLSDYIQPICVDQGNHSFTINSQCWASGWGSGGGGISEQTLQQFNTTILDCGSASSSTSSICTGVMPLEQTHKGGPLMCKFGQNWVQAAVLSLVSNLTKGTRASTAVQVFTKTSIFSQFLQSVVMYFPPEIYTPSPAATTASSSASESSSFLSILEPAPDPADIQKVPDSVGRHPANCTWA
ncbi:polyserase-2-like [Salminus brasiliensis]|uniref:polyserase-2-like n=1 Tax=Salminus brasiliensis TaxID=930266 RepID=UPI003B82CD1D